MLASAEMINMEIYLIRSHAGVAHNEAHKSNLVGSGSEERIEPACKIISMRKRLEAAKEIEIRGMFNIFNMRNGTSFSTILASSDRGTCAAMPARESFGMCGMCLLLILHLKLK